MSTRRGELFTTIRTEGGLLPSSLLARVAGTDGTLPGLRPDDYHLTPGERLTDRINASWRRLIGAWTSFTNALAAIPVENPAQGLTYDRWLLILFSELGYGRLQRANAVEIDGQTYTVSHAWGPAPIHLVGAHVELDRRTPGVAGAAKISPHGLVQDLLNRSDERLWGFVSNGLRLRILRDNVALTRQAYVEFDLQAMMDGEVYSDFVVLWLLAHQSRVEASPPEDCWLEQWSVEARVQGARALDHLRGSVEDAIKALGSGFLNHPNNTTLRAALRGGRLRPVDYYRQLLRVVYRMLFLLVAEQRDLLLLPPLGPASASTAGAERRATARAAYNDYYSLRRVRQLAERRRGTRHGDLWQQIQLVVRLLGTSGNDDLALPAFGSYLFSSRATPDLDGSTLSNTALLAAIRALSGRDDDKVGYRWLFDYANLGVEELGSVYESLLELHPDVDLGAGAFTLTTGGKERRATGSHYTPPTIIKRVLDFALEPAITRALAAPDAAAALLDLRVLDPAVGSGHFLIAAAYRIARALATVRTGEAEPPPADVRAALRDVVARCVYGADLNPMAVELCRVALWLETLDPGKPLSYLDHHIRVGNSLLGVPLGSTVERNRTIVENARKHLEQRIADIDQRLRVLPAFSAETGELNRQRRALQKELDDCTYDSWADAIPDVAFKASLDDDKAVARRWARENRLARKTGQMQLHGDVLVELPDDLVALFDQIGAGAEDNVAEVTIRAKLFEGAQRRAEYTHLQQLADAWTGAFFWSLIPGAPQPPHQAAFLTLQETPGSLSADTAARVAELAEQRRFFHFELAFPEVFTAERGGFDVVVGNPPYLMGMKISGTFGEKVLAFLKANYPAQTGGRVDLAAYFLRRGFDLLRPGGDLAFVTTNSIAEGDTAAAGLQMVTSPVFGGEIVDAVTSVEWTGVASVTVSLIHLTRGARRAAKTLNGRRVATISASLSDREDRHAQPLQENAGLIFKGSNPLGEGFKLDGEERDRLIRARVANADVIFPLYGARDLTHGTSTAPTHWIIDFGTRTLEECRPFVEPLERVVATVKSARLETDDTGAFKVKRKTYRDRWWQFAERSSRMYEAVAGLSRIIAIPEVSTTMLPGFLPANSVYLQTCFIVASDDVGLLGVLTSNIHWLWAAMPGHCTSMQVNPRYHQERCFENFPRPTVTANLWSASEALVSRRSDIMRQRGEGLTKLYGRVLDASVTSVDIVELRRLHVALDEAVAEAYGWSDLVWDHGLHPTERFGVRWTAKPETQREIERRLLDLNLTRSAEQAR